MSLIKSRKRVADHGEVFTPAWLVDAMPDLVKDESERIDSRFLEPACGNGNFVVEALQRKLASVEDRHRCDNAGGRVSGWLPIGF
jgi:type I restriction-modification system DNA methylase subunit